MRLAVELGAERVRIAVADGAGGPPRILPDQPGPPAAAVRAAARRLASAADPLDQLIVVHPTHWTASTIESAASRCAVPGVPVRACPSALAAAEEALTRAAHPPGPLGVLELARSGTTASVLSRGPDRSLLACRHVPGVDGERAVRTLAASVAAAHLEPEALTAGVLLLATQDGAAAPGEPITDLIGEPPWAPADPSDVALLGALRPPTPPVPTLPRSVWARPDPGPADGAVVRSGEWTSEAGSAHPLLPPPARRGRTRTALTGVAVSLTAAGVTAWTGAVVHQPTPVGPTAPSAVAEAQPEPTEVRAGLLAQYDYELRLPPGWRHSGGLPERRRTLLTPADRPAGSDLIAVEQSPLGFDSAAEPGRALRELHAEHQRAVAAGSKLSDLSGSVPVGDRRAIIYRQHQPATGAEVDWYVLFERDAQLSVGCQHTAAGADAVRSACEQVLRSLRLR